MSKSAQYLFVFLLVIFSINFFEFRLLSGSAVSYLRFGFILIAVGLSLPYFSPKRSGGFVLPLQLISMSMLLSIFACNITWQQNLSDCLIGTIPFLIWPFFFYLKHVKFPIEKIEQIVLIYGFVYLVLYFFQLVNSGTAYFGYLEEFDLSRGIARIIFPGTGVFYFSAFLVLCKFTEEKKNKLLWGIFLGVCLIVTVLQVTRQFIFAIILIYAFHFLKKQNIFKIIIVISLLAGALLYISQSDNEIVKGLNNVQKDNLQEGADYVRVQAATYFLTDFSPSVINRVLGNGVPYGDNSSYKRFINITEAGGFYFSDVGLIGVYAMFGVLAVLGYILIWIKSFTIKLPPRYFYLKYYLWFLLFSSLTSNSIYGTGTLITTIYVLYCYQRIYEDEKYGEFDTGEYED